MARTSKVCSAITSALLMLIGVLTAVPAHASLPAGAFVSTWNTEDISSGSTPNNQIALPLDYSGTFDFIVDWGDSTSSHITTWDQPERTHTYNQPGQYTLKITGTIKGWQFDNNGDRLKIHDIEQWGDLNFGNSGAYFEGAANLTASATDAPDLTGVTNLSQTFAGASKFNGEVQTWNTTNVTNMSGMFVSATAFDQPIGTWDTGNVTDMSGMFYLAKAFNQPIGGWNTGNVTTMSSMFEEASNFNQPIGAWDTSKVIKLNSMFYRASSFNQDIGTWNTANVTEMVQTFASATAFNQDIGGWNTANVTNMTSMFLGAESVRGPVGRG